MGFSRERATRPRLFEYETIRSAPVEVSGIKTINAYLVDGADILVGKRRAPLSPDMPKVVKGSMPSDGGHLVVQPDAYDAVSKDPAMAPYLRPYVGSKELINNQKRWCLWLQDMDPAAPSQSSDLKNRLKSGSPDMNVGAVISGMGVGW